MTARFLALFPSLTDTNGDAQNALVLARRAGWAGEPAETAALEPGETPPIEPPAAVVLGSGADSVLPRLREALLPLAGPLTDWLAAGVPLLAVGTGLEVLCRRMLLGSATADGLGLVPADVEPLAARVAGDLAVDAPEGRLVGYENHARGLRLDAGVEALGRVARGVGDGHGVDGVRTGGILGTRMHGPVLAKNPALADAILSRIFGRPVTPDTEQSRMADAAAATLRARVAPLNR